MCKHTHTHIYYIIYFLLILSVFNHECYSLLQCTQIFVACTVQHFQPQGRRFRYFLLSPLWRVHLTQILITQDITKTHNSFLVPSTSLLLMGYYTILFYIMMRKKKFWSLQFCANRTANAQQSPTKENQRQIHISRLFQYLPQLQLYFFSFTSKINNNKGTKTQCNENKATLIKLKEKMVKL